MPLSRPNPASLLRPIRPVIGRIEVAELRRFGRSGLGWLFRTDVLVLTTTGRRTGLTRDTPVAYVEYEDGWLISGGAGGQRVVDWVANLRACPQATITVRRETHTVVAEPLRDAAYDAARRVALERWPRIETYERRAERPVPIFVLRRSPMAS